MMINPVKKAFFKLIDKTMTQQGQIISVRKWEPSEMYEVQVRLPEVDMQKWNTVPRIKVKVAEYEYRDYSPACWKPSEGTCYLFIDARHTGAGSSWTRNLMAGQTFRFAPASAAPLPLKKGAVLCLGDESALCHFLALKQLITDKDNPKKILISIDENAIVPKDSFLVNEEIVWIKRMGAERLTSLHRCLSNLDLSCFSSIYLAGNIPMVKALRGILKGDQCVSAQILANGFWS